MTYAEIRESILNAIKDEKLDAIPELLDTMGEIETVNGELTREIEEKDNKIRELQDTNIRLLMRITNNEDEPEDEEEDIEELSGQEYVDAFFARMEKGE